MSEEKNYEEKKHIEELTKAVKDLTQIQRKVLVQHTLSRSFIRGIFYALGTTLGLAIVSSLAVWILNSLGIFDNFKNLFNNLRQLNELIQ